MKERIEKSVEEAVHAVTYLRSREAIEFIETAAVSIADCFARGGKLLIAGNGGSLCDAAHFAEELTGFFRKKRKALPALCLNDPGHMSCVGNDAGFEQVFARCVEAFGKEGDIFVALTTSGNSQNLVEAVRVAQERELSTIAFLGKGGGVLKDVCDVELDVPGFIFSDRIQEVHMSAIHIIIEMVESRLLEMGELVEEMLVGV